MATSSVGTRPALDGSAVADVCVVGAGIAGLSVAYELAREGRSVIVVDSKQPGGGETGRTTAHLASALDDGFAEIERVHGAEGARRAAESHGAAVDRIEAIAREEAIECDLRRLDGWLFLAPGDDPGLLDDELEAAARAGMAVERRERSPLPFETGPVLRYAEQGDFHPLRYVDGLVGAIERRGGRVHGGSHVVEVEAADGGRGMRVKLRNGDQVACGDVVLATNSPARQFLTPAKMVPYRTFAIAVGAPPGLEPGLYWDTEDPYHYVRLAGPPGAEVMIVGGEDHQTGTADDGDARLVALEGWMRTRFPGAGEVVHRWSGQVLEPADFMGFIGRAPGADHVWVCTGDSGQGMTHGVIAGMLIRELMAGRGHEWADLYSPSRFRVKAIPEYIADGVKAGGHFLEWLMPGEVDREEEVEPGHGAIVREGFRPIAVFRDGDGTAHRRSAVCTHMGCIVHWNSTERSWDCPCHGSRYDPSGNVLSGPTTRGLDPA